MQLILSQDDFQYWIFEMDDALEQFLSIISKDLSSMLDYSKDSLDLLENFILLHYKNILDIEKPGEGFILDKLSRYVGETYRKALGAKWQIQLDDPHYAYYGIPELTSRSPLSTPICPLTLVTASVDRKTGIYLRTVLENIIPAWK